MKLFIIFLSTIAFVSLFSCNNSLTREKAENIIKDFYEYPNVALYEISLEGLGRNESILKSAVNAGFMTSRYDIYAAMIDGSGNVYEFTEKAEPYIVSKMQGMQTSVGNAFVVSNCRSFDKITGIKLSENEKSADVNFTCTVKGVTPIGEFLGVKNGDIQSYSIKIYRYDDGWKIEGNKNNVKPEKFSFFTKDGDYKKSNVLTHEQSSSISNDLNSSSESSVNQDNIHSNDLSNTEKYNNDAPIISSEDKSQIKWIKCEVCNGSGLYSSTKNCTVCNGVGKIECKKCNNKGYYNCENCEGKGYVVCTNCNGNRCSKCNNSGYLSCTACEITGVSNGKIWCKDCKGAAYKCKSCLGKAKSITQETCSKCNGTGQIQL